MVPGGAESVSWCDPTFFLVCTVAGWLVLLRREIDWSALFTSNRWLFVFFTYMLISVCWSPEEFVSFKRWVRTFGDLTMALVLVTEPDVLAAMTTVLRRCVFLLVPLSVLLIKYYPSLGRSQAKHWGPDSWIGVATHKNTLGQLCLLALFWLVIEVSELWRTQFESRAEKRYRWSVVGIYAVLTLWLLNGGGHSRSFTSILAALAGISIFIGLQYFRLQPRLFRTWVVAGLGAWLFLQPVCEVVYGRSLYELILASQGKDRTLTDRTVLWEDCIRIGMRHAVLGAGYRGFWTDSVWLEIKERNPNGPEEAHNGYIEVFLDLGVLGVMLFVPVVGAAILGATRSLRWDYGLGQLRFAFLTSVFLHNYAESGFPRPTHLIWFVFLVNAVNYEPESYFDLHPDV
jgi:O-antigen ligase